jgi:hypothetical protein
VQWQQPRPAVTTAHPESIQGTFRAHLGHVTFREHKWHIRV